MQLWRLARRLTSTIVDVRRLKVNINGRLQTVIHNQEKKKPPRKEQKSSKVRQCTYAPAGVFVQTETAPLVRSAAVTTSQDQ